MDSDRRLDQRLVSLIDASIVALITLVLLFLGYFLAGITAVVVGVNPSMYPFLAVDDDPVLALFSALVGMFICTGSLA